MKPALFTLFAALTAQAAGIPLCLSKLTVTENFSILRAQSIVTNVFSSAGVRVEWLSSSQCKNAPGGAIYVILEASVPSKFKRETLGYSQPYNSGTAVHIFYGRIRQDHPTDLAVILGHTMAHEIAHVLQGIDRHSESGIMKAQWNWREYSDMHAGQLRFASEDVELLQLGLKNLAVGNSAARF